MSTTTHQREPGARPLVDKAQYGLAAFLVVVGGVVLYDAVGLEDGFADQPVQPYAIPYVVGAVLVVLGVLLGGRHRPRRPARGRGGRGHRPHPGHRPPHRRPAGGGPRRQHRADRLARLGDHRRPALRRLRRTCWAAGPTSATSRIGTGPVGRQLVRLLRRPRDPDPGRHPGRSPLMDMLLDGFQTALTPENLLFATIGVLLGTAVGVLPGIGPAMTLALLLPVALTMGPDSAIIMFAGIYYGGMYGGSTTSILLNTPGESSSVVTAIEGNKMAKSGRAAQALATAAIGSFVAGTIGTVLLWVLVAHGRRRRRQARRAVVLRHHAARAVRGDRRARRVEAARLHRPVPGARDRADRHARRARRGSRSASRCSPTASTSSWSRSRSSRSARRSGSPRTCAASRWRSSRSASRG